MSVSTVSNPATTQTKTSPDAVDDAGEARLKLSVIRSTESLPAAYPDWISLRDAHGIGSPNSNPVHYAAAIKGFGAAAEPYVAGFSDAIGLRAIIVGRRSARPLPCRLGYLPVPSPKLRCLDVIYGGIITDGSYAAVRDVSDHLNALLQSGEVDHVMINHLHCSHELFATLTDRSRFPGATLRSGRELHWRFLFSDGPFENTLKRFTRKHRYNIRRADRCLCERFKGDVRLHCITAVNELDAFIDEAVRITADSYQGAIGAGIGNPEIQRLILSAAADDGRLRCYLLIAAGEAIAFQTGIMSGGILHLQSIAFLPQFSEFSPGQVLLVRVLEDLHASGASGVDYGFGDARYKRIYGTNHWEEATILLYSRSLRTTIARRMLQTTSAATRLSSRLTAKVGWTDRIKKQWRDLLGRSARRHFRRQRER